MPLDTYDDVLEYYKISFYDEPFEDFNTFDDAYERLRAKAVEGGGRNQGILAALKTPEMKEGMRTLIEPHIELSKAWEIKDIDEKLSEFEDLSDVAEELPKGKGSLKLKQQSGRGKAETRQVKAFRSRFLEEISPETLSGRRNIWSVGNQFGFNMETLDDEIAVRERMEELGYEVDASGRIIK